MARVLRTQPSVNQQVQVGLADPVMSTPEAPLPQMPQGQPGRLPAAPVAPPQQQRPARQPGGRPGRKKGRRGDRGLKVRQDLLSAAGLIEEFGLAPNLVQVAGALESGPRRPELTPSQMAQKSLLEKLQMQTAEGFAPEERTLFREQASEGLSRNFATTLRGLAASQAGRGVRGAAAQAGFQDLAAERAFAQRGIERDLAEREIGFKETARGELQNLVNQLAQEQLLREKVNVEQEARQQAVRQANLFNLLGIRGSRRGQRQANKLFREQLATQEAIAAANREAQLAVAGEMAGLAGGF